MIRLFSVVLLVSSLLATQAVAASVKVIDGDTIKLGDEIVRIYNIDTPEIRDAKCAREKARGLQAKSRLRSLLKGASITVKRGDGSRLQDRYGRTLALVYVDGRDVGLQLVDEGLARRWSGKRRSWCGKADS